MTNAQITDLKQFFTGELSKTEARLTEDMRQFVGVTVSQSEARLEERLIIRMDNGFAGVADAVENLQGQIDDLGKKVDTTNLLMDKRVAWLEQRDQI